FVSSHPCCTATMCCSLPTAPPQLYPLSLHDALPIYPAVLAADGERLARLLQAIADSTKPVIARVQGAALAGGAGLVAAADFVVADRKSTRLNSSHVKISYAVFCLKKKTQNQDTPIAT